MPDSHIAPADLSPAPSPEGKDLTALISHLAREFSSALPSGPAGALPSALPSNSSGPSFSPSLAEPQGALIAPPVHPTFDPLEDTRSKPEQPRIAALDPGNKDGYAFGEPHRYFHADDLGQSKRNSSASDAYQGPEYYFLPDNAHEISGKNLSGNLQSPGRPIVPGFDLDAVRKDFPALNQKVKGNPLIWLDNAATTQKPQAVIDATSLFYGRDNSNIHRAAHVLAERSTKLFEASREKVRRFLGAGSAKEIIFLRGTTEAINLVAQSYGKKNIGAGDEIVLTTMEHHANIVPWQLLAEQTGAVIRVAPINDSGELILEEFAALLGPKTKIVSVAHVSNSLGTINPIEQIIALAHARGIPVLVDGAQSSPHFPINVSALDVDFFTISGHKVFGPTGIGVLYGKAHLLEQMPPWQGGGHMIKDVTFEKTVYQNAPEKFEAGTPDIAGVVGLGAAVDYLMGIGMPAIGAYEHALLEYATQQLQTVPGLRFIGTASEKASVLSFVIPGISNQDIAKYLDDHGIAVRAGHHCALPAMRHFGQESTVRPSLAFYNTSAEVDTLVYLLKQMPRKR